MKRLRVQPGDLIKIPYKEGMHTYGRIIVEGSYAIYDCPSAIENNDYENIINSDILFIARVDVFAIKESYWTVVKNIPLEERLKNFYPRYFNPVPTNSANVNFYEAYKSEIEEAIKKDWIKTGRMQLDGIHGRVHVESRINDYYESKRNKYNKANIEVFKKYIGYP